MKKALFIIGVACLNVTAQASVPEGYYDAIDGKSSTTLWNALYNIISNHKQVTYDFCRADHALIDVKTDGTVWDMYSNCTFDLTAHCPAQDSYTNCECYNREHALPKSFWGGSTTEPMYTDLMHVIPTDGAANSKRSAWVYGEVKSTSWSNAAGAKYGTNSNGENSFEPPSQYKGDIARIYFYMLTCYKNKKFTAGGRGSVFFTYSNSTAGFTTYGLNLMLKWARADAVSEKEIDRNDLVYRKQGNRNPFVDFPDLFEYIWGNKKGQAFNLETTTDECTPDTIEGLKTELGDFYGVSVKGDASWNWENSYGACFKGNGVTNWGNENWLMSPTLDLTGAREVSLLFSHAINKGDVTTMKSEQTLWVSNDYVAGEQPSTATWYQLPINVYPTGSNWTFKANSTYIPDRYLGATTTFAFKYTCGEGAAASWEIKNWNLYIPCEYHVGVPTVLVDQLDGVYTRDGKICIDYATDEIHIFDIVGRCVYSTNQRVEQLEVAVPKGIYLVRSGNKVAKTIVQ